MNDIRRRITKVLKPIVDSLGIGQLTRQAYVELLMMGERARFIVEGRPDPSAAILLAGSGRSGTTWIGDVLCMLPNVQQIFEPFHPRFNQDVIRITGWEWEKQPHYHYFKATYLRPELENPKWTDTIERVFAGRTRNYFTDYVRTSLFPNRFLIKDIWVNLMLGYISKRFNPKIIYIIRHPCAVVHSRLRVNWYATVQDILMQPQLINDHLKGFVREIKAETDVLGAHAVWWAVENSVALRQLKDIPHRMIFYEDLSLRPKEILEDLVLWLGYDNFPPTLLKILDKPSRTSNQQVDINKQIDRLSYWKHELSLADQQRVLDWASRLGLSMYDTSPFPLHKSSQYA